MTLFLLAFGFSFLGLIIGSTIVLVVGKANPTWFCDVGITLSDYICRCVLIRDCRIRS